MKTYVAMIFSVIMLVGMSVGLTGCVTLKVSEGKQDSSSTRGQALESGESCKDRCMEDFHRCKDQRQKGQGASHCAHQKNACKKSC
jgi:hypothetical protein